VILHPIALGSIGTVFVYECAGIMDQADEQSAAAKSTIKPAAMRFDGRW